MRKLYGTVLLSAWLSAMTAKADQCQVVTQAQADAAVSILRASEQMLEFCEPCGDVSPSVSALVPGEISVRAWNGNNANATFYEVTVNGRAVDLAYVFVPGQNGYFDNLAQRVGCTTVGVSERLPR